MSHPQSWHEARRRGLGGSDMAAVMGLSRYTTALDVWLDKTGQGVPREETPAMRMGTLLEPVVAALWAGETGARIRRRPQAHDKQRPYLLGNLDRWAALPDGKAGPLEIKTTQRASDWADGAVPDEAAIQLQHYVALTGAAQGWAACLVSGRDLVWREVARDDALIEAIRAAAAAFWPLVESRTPPDPERWTCSMDAVRALYPTAQRETAELPDVAGELAAQLLDAKARAKAADAEAEHLQATLCMMMGDAAKASAGGYRLNWTPTTASRFDSTAFKAEHPDLHAAYCRTTTGRRFSAFGPKE